MCASVTGYDLAADAHTNPLPTVAVAGNTGATSINGSTNTNTQTHNHHTHNNSSQNQSIHSTGSTVSVGNTQSSAVRNHSINNSKNTNTTNNMTDNRSKTTTSNINNNNSNNNNKTVNYNGENSGNKNINKITNNNTLKVKLNASTMGSLMSGKLMSRTVR